MAKIYYSKVLHAQGRFMVRRLLYFIKNATIAGRIFKKLASMFANIEYSWSKRFLVGEYSVTEIHTCDIPNPHPSANDPIIRRQAFWSTSLLDVHL